MRPPQNTASTSGTRAASRCRRPSTLIACAVVLAAALAGCGGGGGSGDAGYQIKTLSTSAERVSGGDVLVEVDYPTSVVGSLVRVNLNGQDVTSSFSEVQAGVLRGLVTGLRSDPTGAANTIAVARADLGPVTQITVVNYPITGPILSGPHLTPYECRTVENGLGQALDADCSATQQITWWYRAANGTFKALANPAGPLPSDLVNTTTVDGVTVPYIVRVDSGTINRGVYRIAVLDDPSHASQPWKPTAGWNKRLIVSFGCCGSANYNQGQTRIGLDPLSPLTPFVLSDRELSKGYALAVSSELWNNQHANPHLEGETLMMLKEYFIERYGIPKWTAGYGGSGGSIQQYLIAQLYPGLLDGLQAFVSFPETIMQAVPECRLFDRVYAADPAVWTSAKQVAAQGFNAGTCLAWDQSFATPMVVAGNVLQGVTLAGAPFGCGLQDASKAYDPVTNPTGARCSILDTQVNLLGRDPTTGFARRPFDNVGVQYGLGALKRGDLSVDEFLELNEGIGGFDRDGNLQAARMVGDPEALRLTYEGGLLNGFKLSPIPIITFRANADEVGDIHDPLQDLIIRARLQKANGRTDNQAILWSSPASAIDMDTVVLDMMTRWLDALVADPAAASYDKVASKKPADVTDTCWNKTGQKIVATISTDPASACAQVYPLASNPHIEAGQSLANDVLKCQLKPIDYAADYGAVVFTAPQKARLEAVFPQGTCDYSKAGVQQLPLRGTYLKLPLG
jgi:hypothetical protein